MTGQKTVYLNQPVEVLKYLTVASVKSNEVGHIDSKLFKFNICVRDRTS